MNTMRAVFYVSLFSALATLHLRLTACAFDDAYIHVRIAQHLVTYGEPYFNLGEPVMASSSPLWTLVVAAMLWFGFSALNSIAILNSVLTTLNVWIYATLLRGSASRGVAPIYSDMIVAAVLVPILAASSLGLMETPLAILLYGSSLLLLRQRKPMAFAVFAAAAFVRLELGLVLVVFGAAVVIRRWFRIRDVVLYATITALPLVSYELYFYNTIIPHTIYAKSRAYELTFLDVVTSMPGWWRFSSPLARFAVFVTSVVVALGLVLNRPVDWLVKSAFLCGVGIVGAYLSGGSLMFAWYGPLFLVSLTWPVLVLLLSHSGRGPDSWIYRVACLSILIALTGPAIQNFVWLVRGGITNMAYAPSFSESARVRSYIAIGKQLAEQFPEHRLMTSEIGGLGFGFGGPIDDGFGLVSPGALKYHPLRVPQERNHGGTGAIPPDYIAALNPPLILSYDIFVEAFRRSPLVEGYKQIDFPLWTGEDTSLAQQAGYSIQLWGIRRLTLFVRRDLDAGIRSSSSSSRGE